MTSSDHPDTLLKHNFRSMILELSWLTKLKIAITAGAGILLIGILCWPMVKPSDPYDPVAFCVGQISLMDVILVSLVAFISGLIGYFISWPYGKDIGVIAVPSGLALWALRSGTIGSLMQAAKDLQDRMAVFNSMKFESFLWLMIIAAGFTGVMTANTIVPAKENHDKNRNDEKKKTQTYLYGILAVLLSAIIGLFVITILAQGVRQDDTRLGSVVAQPHVSQIAFAVFCAFALAAFAAKQFFDKSYICTVISAPFVTWISIIIYAKPKIIEHLLQNQPAIFFPHPAIAVLPVQMLAFGSLGSVLGYWLAIKFNYWRKSEIK